MTRTRGGLYAAMAALVAVASLGASAAQETAAAADARIRADFLKRIEDYMALHQKVDESLPRLARDATPVEIDRHQRELGARIEKARAGSAQGDVFTKEIRAYFRRQMIRAFRSPEGRRLRKTIMDENPGPIRLRVNGRYPDTVPLSTMPPSVLEVLPKLPLDMEFRFIGKRLILHDIDAHIIVDYIENALPN
jgi:hypothetical protein